MIKNNIIYIFINFFEKGVSLLLLPLYSAYLSPADFGVISLMNVLIAIVTSFSISPITNAMQRFYLSSKYEKKKLFFLFLLFLLLKASFFSLLLLIFNDYIAKQFIENIELINLVNYFILIYLLSSFVQLFTQLFILEQNSKVVMKVNISKGATIFIFTSLSFLADFGVYSIIYGLITGLIVALLMLVPRLKGNMKINFQYKLLIEPLKYGYPLILVSFSQNLLLFGDRYILKLILGLATVGVYSYAYTIANIISILLVMPNKMAMQPVVLAQESAPEKVVYLLNRYAVVFFSIGLIFVLWFSAFSKELIILISSNDEFISGWIIVPIIAFTYLLHGLGNYLGFGVVMAKKSFILSFQAFIAASVNIILNFILIYPFGMVGAALATFFSYCLWNYLKLKASYKYYGLKFDINRINEVFFVGLFSIGVIYIIEIFQYHLIYKLMFLFSVSYYLYRRFLTDEDRKVFINICHEFLQRAKN